MPYSLQDLLTLDAGGAASRLLAAVLVAAPPDRVYGRREEARAGPTARGEAPPEQLLAWAGALDGDPAHRGVALSARMALSLYDAHQEWASVGHLEDDHGHDAALRLVALAQLVTGAYDGPPGERAAAFLGSPAGQALAVWLAAVELALAFLPVDDPLGDHVATELFGRWSGDLPPLAPDVAAVLDALLPSLDSGASACAAGASWVADAVRAGLPELSDRSRDTLAAESTALPVYQILVARLLGELAVGAEGGDPRASFAAELAGLQQRLARLEQEVAVLDGDLADASLCHADLAGSLAANEAALAVPPDPGGAAPAESTRAHLLERHAADLHAIAAVVVELDARDAELADLEAALAERGERLAERMEAGVDVDLGAAEAAAESARAEARTAADAVAALEREIAGLRAALEANAAEIAAARERAEAERDEARASFGDELAALEQEVAVLDGELAGALVCHADLARALAANEAALAAAPAPGGVASAEGTRAHLVERHAADLHAVAALVVELDASIAALADLEAALVERDHRLSERLDAGVDVELRAAEAAAESARAEARTAADAVATLEREIAGLRAALEANGTEIAEARERAAAEAEREQADAEREAALLALEAELARLQAKLAGVDRELADAAAHHADLAAALEANEAALAEGDRVRAGAMPAPDAIRVHLLERHAADLHAVAVLAATFDANGSVLADLESALVERGHRLGERIDASVVIDVALRTAEASAESARAEALEAADAVAALELEIAGLRAALETSHANHAAARASAAVGAHLAELEAQLASEEVELERCRQRIDETEARGAPDDSRLRLAELEADAAQRAAEARQHRAALRSADDDLVRIEAALGLVTAQEHGLAPRLEARRAALAACEADIERLETDAVDLIGAQLLYDDQILRLEGEVAALRDQVAEAARNEAAARTPPTAPDRRAALGITERRRADEPAPAAPSTGAPPPPAIPTPPSDLLARMRALKASGVSPTGAPPPAPAFRPPPPGDDDDDDDDATTLLTTDALAARRAALLAEADETADDVGPEDGDVTMLIQRVPRPTPEAAPEPRTRVEVWRPPPRK
ncbi:MAG: hypothetical protein Q8P18_06265 [Pseudomonadota bacterium]|nr:hypothetical protein [Pseudomonadota bacterium]